MCMKFKIGKSNGERIGVVLALEGSREGVSRNISGEDTVSYLEA